LRQTGFRPLSSGHWQLAPDPLPSASFRPLPTVSRVFETGRRRDQLILPAANSLRLPSAV
jgi:hypothetical protein